jgi:chromosomal replication initiation ATPase DnaA
MLNDVEVINKLRKAFDESVISQICDRTRKRFVFYCRVLAAECCIRKGDSVTKIGKKLNRNHSTVSYYCKNFEKEYEYNAEFRNLADKVLKE